ncbi:MAG TPA: PIN domain-containing protein [Verrucomicrobia bacterium]|jgi:hypothetical protein|nr:PIN domain-containing protein [Verrucomicrobiota bacterium]
MILPDLNILLYAYNAFSPQHQLAKEWWQRVLNEDELIGLPHEILFGFVRIATNHRLGSTAVPLIKAKAIAESWLELPQARLLTPNANHFPRVMNLMTDAMATGALLSDAILASYAIENRACLYTNDSDFARFSSLIWKNPLQLPN